MIAGSIKTILNAHFWLDYIAASGQPSAEQFSLIKEAGYNCVINLALPTSAGALTDEPEIVTSLGMDYVHIPVEWTKPQISQLVTFFIELDNRKGQQIWVHCAMNYRVSTFLFLFRVIRLGAVQMDAWQDVLSVWQPDEVWLAFVQTSLLHYGFSCELQGMR